MQSVAGEPPAPRAIRSAQAVLRLGDPRPLEKRRPSGSGGSDRRYGKRRGRDDPQRARRRRWHDVAKHGCRHGLAATKRAVRALLHVNAMARGVVAGTSRRRTKFARQSFRAQHGRRQQQLQRQHRAHQRRTPQAQLAGDDVVARRALVHPSSVGDWCGRGLDLGQASPTPGFAA